MKNSIAGLSVAVTVLCGFLLFEKNREVDAMRARITAEERRREELSADAGRQAQQTKKLEARLHDSRVEALDNQVAAQDLGQQLANATAPKNKKKTVSDIFQDQMMREALKAEAKEGTAKNIEALFHDGLADQLHLNDAQKTALRELLTQRMSILWERMMVPMMTGELDETGMAQEGQAVKQAIGENTAQLQSLLGDDGYKAYQVFDQTQPERETLGKFSQSEAEAGQELSPDQQNQLMAIMTDERSKLRAQDDFGDPEKMDFENWADNFSDDKISAYGEGLGQANAQIVQRAQAILSPDQVAQLQQELAREALQGLMVVRSTKALMAGDGQ
jgi:hypothetical protein